MKPKHILIFGLIILLTCTYLASAEPDLTQRVVTNASNFISPGSYTEPIDLENSQTNENAYLNVLLSFICIFLAIAIISKIIKD